VDKSASCNLYYDRLQKCPARLQLLWCIGVVLFGLDLDACLARELELSLRPVKT
jgi:hypothetical protein